jgi:hypothetical protein
MSDLGVIRTIRQQQNEDQPDWFGPEESPRSWHVVPGRKLRNDGVVPVVLVPGYTYTLAHDGTGWQLTPGNETPHAYLVDDGMQLVDTIQVEHRTMQLVPGSRYLITQAADGTWSLTVSAEEISAR